MGGKEIPGKQRRAGQCKENRGNLAKFFARRVGVVNRQGAPRGCRYYNDRDDKQQNDMKDAPHHICVAGSGFQSNKIVCKGNNSSAYGRQQTNKEEGMGRLQRWSISKLTVILAASLLVALHAGSALAASAKEIDAKVNTALSSLYKSEPGSKPLANQAKAILVFPDIVKGGFVVTGQYGDGALRKGGKTAGYYRSLAGSVGFQAGAESFGYVVFFMDDASLKWLDKTDGWEIGTGPTLTVLDKGFAKKFTSTTLHKGVYAFVFNQKGLMGGIGIEGSKITKIVPDK
jgi:lipid-binding SYLF domain-containing protein